MSCNFWNSQLFVLNFSDCQLFGPLYAHVVIEEVVIEVRWDLETRLW